MLDDLETAGAHESDGALHEDVSLTQSPSPCMAGTGD